MKLPSKPSDLILLALTDLEAVERMPDKYQISMGSWHEAASGYEKICMVCFAGAVMSQTLHAPPNLDMYPCDFDCDDNKLNALNWFRTGRIELGLENLDIELPEGLPANLDYPTDEDGNEIDLYKKDRTHFKHLMQDLAGILQSEGL